MIRGRSAYPKEVNVEGFMWKIVFKKKIMYEGVECDGLCKSDVRTIFIKIINDPVETYRIFKHELLHAIEFERGIDVPHKWVEAFDRPLAKFDILNTEFKIKILGG